MKNLITTTTALIFTLALFAQDQAIEFTYDATGNRTERHIIELKKDNPDNKSTGKSTEAGEAFAETLGESEIIIFPNPVKGELSIEITNQRQGQSATLEVFSLSGKSVVKKEKVKDKTKVDMSKLPPGTYILKIRLGKETSTWKVVKE
ncbi:MAG: T9SS type A sorting domain-containing protein [Chlorobi bacterium]|nr:T9SS type A sorting domain-containing protein [Chlorobiota bacterium]